LRENSDRVGERERERERFHQKMDVRSDRSRSEKKKRVKSSRCVVFPLLRNPIVEEINRLAERLNETKDAKTQIAMLKQSIEDCCLTEERVRWYVEIYAVGNTHIRKLLKGEIFSRKSLDLTQSVEKATSLRTLSACLDLNFTKSLLSSILRKIISISSTFDINTYQIIQRVLTSGTFTMDKTITICISKSIQTLETTSSTSRLLTVAAMTLVNMLQIEEQQQKQGTATTVIPRIESPLLASISSFGSLLRFAFPKTTLVLGCCCRKVKENMISTLALCRALCSASSSSSTSFLRYWQVIQNGIENHEDKIRWYALTSTTNLLKRLQKNPTIKTTITKELLPHLLRNWEHPNKSVSNLIRPLFRLTIALDSSQLSSVFSEILVLPVGSRGKYAALQILLQHQPDAIVPTHKFTYEMIKAVRHESNVAQSASALFLKVVEISSSSSSLWWTEPITKALTHKDSRTRTRTASYILPKLFSSKKINASKLMTSLLSICKNCDEQWLWAVCALLAEIRRKSPSISIKDVIREYDLQDDSFLRDALVHTNEEVRSVALSVVLIDASENSVDLIRHFLCNEGLRTNDPKYRDTVSYHMTKFLPKIQKNSTFLSFLVNQITKHELYPGSPFARTAIAIRLLRDVQRTATHFRFPESVINTLMFQLFSRFNDNRLDAFRFVVKEIERGRTISATIWYPRAMHAIKSTRLYESEGGALALRVLVRMSRDTAEPRKIVNKIRKLLKDNERSKLPGHLLALRAVLTELKPELLLFNSNNTELADETLEIATLALKCSLEEVTSENSSIIAKSSEMSLDKEQRNVVAAWLTTKESSNLLADVIVTFDRMERANDILGLLIETLLNSCHQGAVAKASEALENVSVYLLKKKNQLPSKWLDRLFEYLYSKDTNPKLRRSAGFAAATKALAKSSSKLSSQCFERLIQTLLDSKKEIVRVHALNLLNVLLRDARVFVSQENLSTLFQISVIGFQNETWSLRNSSLLVYSATMSKMFKDHTRSALPLSAFMSRFPDLLPFLQEKMSLLLKTRRNRNYMCMMPMLLLMSRLVPNDDDDDDNHPYDEMLQMLQHLVISAPQSTRVVSARAVVTFLKGSDLISTASRAIQSVSQQQQQQQQALRQNDLHGVFVLVTQLFRVGLCTRKKTTSSVDKLCVSLHDFVCMNENLDKIVGISLSEVFILLREVYTECCSSSTRTTTQLWNEIAIKILCWVEKALQETTSVGVSNALKNATTLLWILAKNEKILQVSKLVNLLCIFNISNDTFFTTSASLLPVLSEKDVNRLVKFLCTTVLAKSLKKETLYQVAALKILASLGECDSSQIDLKILLKFPCRRFASRNAVLKLLGLGIVRGGLDLMMRRSDMMSQWIEMLDRYSRDEAALELRSGVLDSGLSYCLELLFQKQRTTQPHESEEIACTIVRMWRISHRLLVDDDQSIRSRMSVILSRAMGFKFSKNPLLCATIALNRVRDIAFSWKKSRLMFSDTLTDWFCSGIAPCLLKMTNSERLFEDEPLNENKEMLWHVRHANILSDNPRVRNILDEFERRVLPSLTDDGFIRGDTDCALYAARSKGGVSFGGLFDEWFPTSTSTTTTSNTATSTNLINT